MERAENHSAAVRAQKISRSLPYKGIVMVRATAEYFEAELTQNRSAQTRINASVRKEVIGFLSHASGFLYRQAVKDFRFSQAHGYPFRPYEAMLKYTLTYNETCHLSCYYDHYEYTGGAHGATKRASCTWSLQTGWSLPLAALFKDSFDYQRFLTKHIIAQAENNMAENPGIYFEDYKKRIVQSFDPHSYYLTNEGIVVYYQQYDIGPYSSGIAEFLIPFGGEVKRPRC